MTTATTAHQDRWELIADRMWKIPELGWAIAEANPDLAGYLILPAGLALIIPELRTLRRPLTAANPAREDNGEFIQLPPPPPSSVPPSSGGGGSVVFPIKVIEGGTEAVTAQQALLNLGAVALASKGVPGGVMPLDGGGIAPLINLPPYPTLASLGAIAASSRGVADGVAPLDVQIRLPAANLPATIPIENLPLNVAFPFTAGASFRGGTSPANTPTLVQTSIDANGLPRYWLVNANAPANSRIKSITVANNGNVQIRHHNDDLSDGNVLEHTASGNVLTNGTLRCGGGTTNFTGASFVPGSLFFRSDLNMLTYSDGTNWRRMDNNAVV